MAYKHKKAIKLYQWLKIGNLKKTLAVKLGKYGRINAFLMLFKNIFDDDIPGIAAATAFYLLLSAFPLIIIIASLLRKYSIDLENEVVQYLLPGSVAKLFSNISAAVPMFSDLPMIPVVVTLWSASEGIWALMRGICRAYTGKNPEKPFFNRLVALFFVIVFLAVVAFGLTVWFIGESLLSRADGLIAAVIIVIKYSVAFAAITVFVLALYVYTPGYDIKKRQMLPGAGAASAVWLLTNMGFEIYIRYFSNFSALYGSFGTFLGLILWLFIICIVILTGAEINSVMICYHRNKHERRP